MARFDKEQITTVPFALIFVGAVLGIISFFVAWTGGMTGLQFFNDLGVMMAGEPEQWKCYIPLFIFVLSIISLIIALLPVFSFKRNAGITTGVFFIFGLFMIIGMLVFGFKFGEEALFNHAEVGMWLALIGSILIFAVSLYDLKDKIAIIRK